MNNSSFSLGERMKSYYEFPYEVHLPYRFPIIMRLDGKAFHTLTKKYIKPFDGKLIFAMQMTAMYLCNQIQGAQLAYTQSDEISILIYPWKNRESQPWFANSVQKMTSVSAGMASAYMTSALQELAVFDSRVFIIPDYEIVNYFVWRQMDWIRNSVSMLAQSLYSHKELQNKNNKEMIEMCIQKGSDWNELENYLQHGTLIRKDETGEFIVDETMPLIKDNREYLQIDKMLESENE